VIAALLTLIVGHLVLVRVAATVRLRRQRDLERVWLPLLMHALAQVPDALPRLSWRDTAMFLSLWNRLNDAIKGGSNESLHRLAMKLELDRAARRLFAHGRLRDKLLAIATAGRLRDRAMWSDLTRAVSSRDLDLSLAAACALVRIDGQAAITLLLPIIAKRDDWPPSTVALILEEAGAEVISEPLVKAVHDADPKDAHRLIRYLGLAHPDITRTLLHTLIREVTSVESVMACLRVFTDSADVDGVRRHLNHTRWEVRVRAVKALEQIGTVRDVEPLVAMLSDFEWWVRYRAARALCTLLSSDIDSIKRLRAQHTDPFARDILTHVLAEQGAL
jgi:HEAT repeat protein